MLHGLLQVWFGWVRDGGYLGVIALMAMESSILPVPSEIVIPPAAFWASQGRMSFSRRGAGRHLRFVVGFDDYLLGVAVDWPGRDSSLGPDRLHHTRRPEARGALRAALRSRRGLLRPALAGDPPFDLHSSRHRAHVIRRFQPGDRPRSVLLVQRPGVVRRQDHGGASRPDERPGSSHAHDAAGRPLDRRRGPGAVRALYPGDATDQPEFDAGSPTPRSNCRRGPRGRRQTGGRRPVPTVSPGRRAAAACAGWSPGIRGRSRRLPPRSSSEWNRSGAG